MNDSEEEFIDEEEAEGGPAALKKLRERLKKALEEKQEYLEGWQRARADLANYKREEASMHADKEERIKIKFLEELLPALDAIRMARLSLPTEVSADWQKGLRAVHQEFLDALARSGIHRTEVFDLVNFKFDPQQHEILQEVATDDSELDGQIERVLRDGYAIGDKVIRPMQLSMYKFKK